MKRWRGPRGGLKQRKGQGAKSFWAGFGGCVKGSRGGGWGVFEVEKKKKNLKGGAGARQTGV